MISRRKILQLALVSPILAAFPRLQNAPSRVIPSIDGTDVSRIKIDRRRTRVKNHGRDGVKIKEIVLFDLKLSFPPSTKLYGEGFQMLSQTGGTLGQPTDLGNYTDAKHYKLPEPAGVKVLYGMLMLTPPEAVTHLFAF